MSRLTRLASDSLREQGLLTCEEAMALYGISRTTLNRLISGGFVRSDARPAPARQSGFWLSVAELEEFFALNRSTAYIAAQLGTRPHEIEQRLRLRGVRPSIEAGRSTSCFWNFSEPVRNFVCEA